MIHLEFWYKEAAGERDLRFLEEKIRTGHWDEVIESGILEQAWWMARRLGTLPDIPLQHVEDTLLDKVNSAEEFRVEKEEFESTTFLSDPFTRHPAERDAWYLADILDNLRNEPYDLGVHAFVSKSVGPFSSWEIHLRFPDLDERAHRILARWAAGDIYPGLVTGFAWATPDRIAE